MCHFCSTVIESKIVSARRLKTLMPQDFLYMPHRAPVEEQLRGRGMPKQVRRYAFVDAGMETVTFKWSPDIWSAEPCCAVLDNEHRGRAVGACLQIFAKPVE